MSPEKEQVTTMILYVDLKCSCCYNKVRKLLCKFPQVRGQVFDEEKNKVTITVVCCDPEKMRDKLCCKGGKAIQSIEIIEPEPPKSGKTSPDVVVPPKIDSPKNSELVKEPGCVEGRGGMKDEVVACAKNPRQKKQRPPQQPTGPCRPPVALCCQECSEGRGGGPCYHGYERPVRQPQQQPKPMPTGPCRPPVAVCCQECSEGRGGGPCYHGLGRPVQRGPPVAVCCQECSEGRGGGPCYHGFGRPVQRGPPVAVCCQECYEGRGGGPCYHGYERPVPPPPCPCYGYGYGYRPPCYVCRCDCFSEDNPQGCYIM